MKPRSKHTVNEIASWVAKGHSQKPASCRVLLDRIQELEAENARLRERLLRDQNYAPLTVEHTYL